MSKVFEAKEKQGYSEEKPAGCAGCTHFRLDRVLPKWMEGGYDHRTSAPYTVETHGVEKNLHCGLGGFKVKKTAVCKEFTAA